MIDDSTYTGKDCPPFKFANFVYKSRFNFKFMMSDFKFVLSHDFVYGVVLDHTSLILYIFILHLPGAFKSFPFQLRISDSGICTVKLTTFFGLLQQLVAASTPSD